MKNFLFAGMVCGFVFAGGCRDFLSAQTNAPVPPGANPASVYPANPGIVKSATNSPATNSTVNPGTSKPNDTNPGLPGAVSSNPNNPGTIPVAPAPDSPKTSVTDQREHSGYNPGLNPGTTQHRTDPRLNPGTTAPRTYPKINPGTTTPKTEPKLNPGTSGGPGGPKN